MDQSNSSLGVEELLAQYAGAGLDDVKDWNEKNLRRIAEHFERRDFDAIREDYDAGVYDEFLWPADEDEAEFVARFQQALGDSQRLSGVPVEGPPEPTFQKVTELFPPMADPEFHELVEDIRAKGLLTRIWLHPDDRRIIDGRNRYRACREAGVNPEYQIWDGKGRLFQFVVSQNVLRRHLTPAQKAVAAWRMKSYVAEEFAKGKADKIRQQALARPRDESGRLAKGQVRPNSDGPGETTNKLVAKMMGIGASSVALVDKISMDAPDLLEKIESGTINLHRAENDLKTRKALAVRAANAEAIRELPPINEALNCGAKFSAIVIDPPWSYEESNQAEVVGMTLPYADMKFAAIEAMEMPAEDDCALFLWTTNAFLPKSFALLNRWGFRYSATIVWCKIHANGNHRFSSPINPYFKNSVEFVLFGVRGKLDFMPGQEVKNADTWFTAQIGPGGHSSKPPEFLKMVESWVPGPYLEIFSRSERPGWSSYGEGGLQLAQPHA